MKLSEHAQRRVDVAAGVLERRGYAAYLRFMERNKAAHAARITH